MRLAMLIAALLSLSFPHASASAAQPIEQKVLLVISGYGADGGKIRPGYEMDELAQAWHIFSDNGLEVEIASPPGGAVVADRFDPAKPYNKRFLADRAAAERLRNTLPLGTLRDKRYAAIFVIGGKGAMFDLPVNADLKQVLAASWEAGGVIGAVCHGPAALINVPLANGTTLIAGRQVTGFSNEEELLFGKRWAASYPVLLEDGLRGAGGKFSEAPMMLSHVVADTRIVTGQNPYSTTAAAEAVVRAMGRTPVARQPWTDERSISLVAAALAGDVEGARAKLTARPAEYDMPLIAMWGFYRAKTAGQDTAGLRGALEVMQLAAPHFPEPRLQEAIADARQKLK